MITTNNTYATVNGKTVAISTRKFTNDLMKSSAIDLAFQSRARWTYKQKQAFINSCLVDMSISKFILVDVAACLAVAIEKEDIEYFQGWLDKGVKHLIVDSNNRKTTLEEFINNKIKIPVGDYCIGDKVFKVDNDNNTYETMDEDLRQNHFLSNYLSVHIITGATRKQLSDVFMRMNSGESLNIFEKLNCSHSITCEIIRKIATEMSDIFVEAKLFGLNEINRRKIDGWFAQVFYLYVTGTNLTWTDATRRAWYATDSVSNNRIKSFEEEWMAFSKLVDKKIKLFQHKWVYFDLFYQIKIQKALGKRLVDKENIVQDFINMFSPLIADKTVKYFYPKPNEKTNRLEWKKDVDGHGTTVLFPFSELIKGEGGNTPTRFKAYEDAGWDITKYFTDERDKKRVMNRSEKQGIAVRDGWKDSDGDEYVPEELFDGELDAGHILAHGNAGKTIPENMVIEKAEKNRAKGLATTEIV